MTLQPRILIGLVAATAWLSSPPAPRAAPPASTTRPAVTPEAVVPAGDPDLADLDAARCVAAHALSGLDPAEQRTLVALCERRDRPTAELAPTLARVATRKTWEPAALADLLIGAAPHLDLGPDTAGAARLKHVRDALRDQLRAGKHAAVPGCKPLHAALDLYHKERDDRTNTTPPFTAARLAGCVDFKPQTADGLAFLTIPAKDITRLFVSAGADARVVLQWFDPDEAVILPDRPPVFVVVVPRWSVVTVRAERSDSPAPARWHSFVTDDRTVWDAPPAAGCLRLSVDLDPDTALLLDGQLLTRGERLVHRTAGVFTGDHELVAVRCVRGGCSIRFREALAATTETKDVCQDVALDLHLRRSVAVLQSRAAPGCDAALAWRAGALAADHLRRSEAATQRVFRDLASYATITEALGALRDGLNPGAGAAVGANSGPDSLALVGSVAKEAWRQGIDELVTLELRCAGGGDLTLQGTAISVREVFDRSRGPVAGLDLKQVLRLQSVRFRGEAQLESSVSGVLDQLFARSYLRFREAATTFHYRQRARVELAASGRTDRDGKPVLAAYHLADLHDAPSSTCRDLRAPAPRAALAAVDERLRLADAPRALPLTLDRDDSAVPEAEPDERYVASHLVGSFHAPRPGTYLVTARWRHQGAPVVDAVCVRFDVPDRELWGSVMFSPDLTTRTPVAAYASRHLRVILGHTWYRPRPWLGFGISGGYVHTRYSSGSGLPSWQDLDVEPDVSHAPLDWRRHAIVAGPTIELRSRRATIPVEFRGRLSAAAGLAVINVGGLAGLNDFTGASRFDASPLRLRPTVDFVAELGFGYALGPLSVSHVITLGATAVNDMLSTRHAVDATGGAALFAGLGLVLGGSP